MLDVGLLVEEDTLMKIVLGNGGKQAEHRSDAFCSLCYESDI